jgi:predicted Zn finger-like uncharacterized protein
MIFYCPACMAKLKMPDERLKPGAALWVKCPKCGERFHPRTEELDLGPAATGERGQKPGIKELASLISQKSQMAARDRGDPIDLDALPVIPEPPSHATWGLVLSAIMVGLLLSTLAWAFSAAVAPDPPPIAAPPRPKQDYARDNLPYDIMAVRRDILKMRTLLRDIDYRGREYRIYKYFQPILAPEACQDITALRMWSGRTMEGFNMTAVCLDQRLQPAEISFRWDDKQTLIGLNGQNPAFQLPHTE